MAEQDVRTTSDRAGLLQALGFPLEIATEFEPSLMTIGRERSIRRGHLEEREGKDDLGMVRRMVQS